MIQLNMLSKTQSNYHDRAKLFVNPNHNIHNHMYNIQPTLQATVHEQN